MSLPVRAIWTTASTAGFKTGSWRLELPAYVRSPAPCHDACPIDGDIASWIQFVKKEAYREAWSALVANNPFPAVTGRICHRPCEASCNRRQLDEPVAIRCLERFVGDLAIEKAWSFPDVPLSKTETIAVVGGGPAGLSATFHLRRMGYAVTLFEAQHDLGGVLRYGIPPYRLPRDVLDTEIQRVIDIGVDVRTGTPINSLADFENLRSQFTAVFIATGATVPKRLAQLDYSEAWVIESAEFLRRANGGDCPGSGKHIVVIGGGSAAMDVARTARRHGRDVTVLCLESELAMPAQRDEVLEAMEEGIRLVDGAMLRSVTDRGAEGLDIDCTKVVFEAGAGPGNFSITPVPETDFTMRADTIVSAIGQDPDTTTLQDLLDVDNRLVRVDRQQKSSLEGVFAGGDLVTVQRFVSVAFGYGKRAAIAIDRYLGAEPMDEPAPAEAAVPFNVINTHYHPPAPRAKQSRMAAADRQAGFDEVELALSGRAVLTESERCFSCGNCTFCNNCYYYCPDMAVRHENGGYSIDEDYCKGCGLCVRECPTGAILMRAES